MRTFTLLLGLTLFVSSGAGSRLLFICGVDATASVRCHCPHMDDTDPSGAIEPTCCELRELAGAPGSVRASSKGSSQERPVALAKIEMRDPTIEIRISSPRLADARRNRAGADPPIYLALCTYRS